MKRKIGKIIARIGCGITLIALAVIAFLNLWPGVGKRPGKQDKKDYANRTKYIKNGKFKNIRDNLPLMTGAQRKRAKRLKPKERIRTQQWDSVPQGKEGKLNVIWLGHSSSLVQMGEKNVLIDPVLTEYSSPVSFVGVKRFADVPIDPDHMPHIDVMLISHDHYDHMDYETIKKMDKKVAAYVVPLGLETYLKGWGIDENKIHNLAWWEETETAGIHFTATPAQHFSGRNPLDSSVAWWCGFCFSDGKHTVYYSGDGGYSDSFKEIGEKFDIDLALLECGQYDKAWAYCHMFPEETAQAFQDIKADYFIPIHWGAFCICNHAWDDSITRVTNEVERLGLNIATPEIGELVEYDKIESYREEWWREVE